MLSSSVSLAKYAATRMSILAVSAIIIAVTTTKSADEVVATPPYSVTTFATAPTGLSAPDSVTFSSTRVFIGYGNGGVPDGSNGAISNVVEYDFNLPKTSYDASRGPRKCWLRN